MAVKAITKGVDQQLVHLVSHPVRVRALVLLADRTASPKELAAELGEKLSTVSHHIQVLLAMGLIELVEEKRRRGAVEHFYRATSRPIWNDDEWSQLSLEERQRHAAWTMQLIVCDVADAMNAGTFNARSDAHTSRTLFWVDERGWQEVNEIQNEALDEITRIVGESAERLARNGEQGIRASAAMLCAEMPSRAQPRPK